MEDNKNTVSEEVNGLNAESNEDTKKGLKVENKAKNNAKETNNEAVWITILFIVFFFFLLSNIVWATVYSKLKDENSVTYTESGTINTVVVENIKEYGYDFTAFDSNGDGAEDGIAKLTCVDIFGGYGTFRLEVFTLGDQTYSKTFDSIKYTMDDEAYQKLSENIDGDLRIDSVYSVEAVDSDGDGCEELLLRHYAWVETHTNHIGDVVSTLKISNGEARIIEHRLESLK